MVCPKQVPATSKVKIDRETGSFKHLGARTNSHGGLSGRSVRPKRMITRGVFGAIQFAAGKEAE